MKKDFKQRLYSLMEKDKQFEENLWLFLSTGLTNLTNRVNQNYEIIKVNPAKGNQESRRLSFFQLNLIVFIFSYVSIELINYSKILATPLNNNVYFFLFCRGSYNCKIVF
ncbi:hypothetical protein AAX19_09335 [Oenococcus oeni]|nr:hypothetical protein AAX19_09335 [Oenococcus oeni]